MPIEAIFTRPTEVTESDSNIFFIRSDLDNLLLDILLNDRFNPDWLDVVDKLLDEHPRSPSFLEPDLKNFFSDESLFQAFKNYYLLWKKECDARDCF